MESSESFTELMKQAEHCGRVYPVTPNSTWLVVKFSAVEWRRISALLDRSLR